ncbi:hypothetical protein [Halobacillus sp. K22]|uniref:hypothetical protein n=1 Tax=Halobacillus sp. K22 TaxID=3457431 RepID=UPI003FCE1498
MKKKPSYKSSIILLLLIIIALSVTLYVTFNKSNSYHDYVENRVFNTTFKWFDIDFDLYSQYIDEAISQETIDLKTVKELNSTYTNGHENFRELSRIAKTLRGTELDSDRILTKLYEISITLKLLKQHVEESGTSTLKLSEDQIKFLKNINAFNSILKGTREEYSEIDDEEFFEYDNRYWIEYLSEISKRSNSVTIYEVY